MPGLGASSHEHARTAEGRTESVRLAAVGRIKLANPLGDSLISRRPKPPKTPGNQPQPPRAASYDKPCNQGKSS
jgi:hypothetical protein